MEAVREREGKREMAEGEDADDVKERDHYTCTHQSTDHLKSHRAESPPVHSWAIWMAV